LGRLLALPTEADEAENLARDKHSSLLRKSEKYGRKNILLNRPLGSQFERNYVAFGVSSVIIIGKYIASDVNYAIKSFVTLAPCANIIKLFSPSAQ
jgi:hypothetical protein